MRGKVEGAKCVKIDHKDHPRLCGEKQTGDSDAVKIMGSPPPMRGKGFAAGVLMPACGITPAYAGKSFTDSICTVQNKDHPRLCGEKGFYKKVPSVGIGSPPPMRGKVKLPEHGKICLRITPAYAGKRGIHTFKT